MNRLCILLAVISIAILMGGQTPFPEVWSGAVERIFGGGTKWNALLDERLPRLIVLLASGAALSVSGATMQSLFQNPLASPGILGLTSGGSLFVTFLFVSGLHAGLPLLIPAASIGGSLATLIVVYSIAKRKGEASVHSLVLTGIAISTVLIALQSALFYSYRADWGLIQVLTEWQAGSTYNRNWTHVNIQLPITLVGLFVALHYRNELNLLALGEDEANNLGVEVPKIRWRLFLAIALLSGGALASVGTIAFFGLVIPHIARAMTGPNYKTLIPYSLALGALSLPALDLLLRSFSLYAITIGNISAIVGGCFFFFLLLRKRGTALA